MLNNLIVDDLAVVSVFDATVPAPMRLRPIIVAVQSIDNILRPKRYEYSPTGAGSALRSGASRPAEM